MWKLQESDEFLKRQKAFQKKHKGELLAVRVNFNRYHAALVEGAKPLQVQFGFVHLEPMGVIAIDQKGGGKSLKETRLYVYPEVETQIVYVITIGDKSKHGQQQDIATCRDFVAERRKIIANEQENIQQRAGNGPSDVRRPGGRQAPGGEDPADEDRDETHGNPGE